MRKECEQLSLYDTYKDVSASMENDQPKLFRLLDNTLLGVRLSQQGFILHFTKTLAARGHTR